MVGAAFIVSSPWIAIIVFIMGIVALVQGYGMKSSQHQPGQQQPTHRSNNGQHYKTGLGIPKKDPKNKGAI